MDWMSSFFAWPDGGVWSNLLASVIWTVPALAWHHRKMKQHITATLGEQRSPEPAAKEAAQ